MHLLWICAPLLLSATVANALQNFQQLKHRLRNDFGRSPLRKRSLTDTALTVELNIDHFGGGQGTFKNRYWINDTYYNGGPVFVYDVGEDDAEYYYDDVLQEDYGVLSSVLALAKKYRGLAILWEHRYYGQSVPFLGQIPSVDKFTVKEWQYLTVDQALEDFAVFAKGFTLPSTSQVQLKSTDALRPQNTPWVVVGASYPGVRAALLRIRNPEVVFASWSSSGPVQAQINMASYYEAIERALPRNCSADWVAVTKYVDGVLMGDNSNDQLTVKKALYDASLSGPGGNTTQVSSLSNAEILALSSGDIADILTYPLWDFQSYGLQVILPFCDSVETLNFTSNPTPGGISVTQGVNKTFQAFVNAIAELDKGNPSNGGDFAATISWMWQYCSEFGFFQVADPDNPVNIVTTYYTVAQEQEWCDQSFSDAGFKQPNVTAINKYGGWNMTPSNVFFSNGQYDPWRTLSVNSQESNSPQRNGSETVPACNASPQFPSFFGTTYTQQVHGADVFLISDGPQDQVDAFNKGLTLFSSALDQWLSCYHVASSSPSSGGDIGTSSQRSLNVWLFLSFLSFLLI